jgi:2-keto-myo-inositol isomerase
MLHKRLFAITLADRVFPGDGSAPLPEILNELRQINPEIVLSLELFNPDYWKMDALRAASTGLLKMKEICQPGFPS